MEKTSMNKDAVLMISVDLFLGWLKLYTISTGHEDSVQIFVEFYYSSTHITTIA